jgi:hypothetical protein
MAVRIEIDIFSGRPNPVIELKGKEAREALERLQPVRRLERGERGLPQRRQLERAILATAPPQLIPASVLDRLE